MPQKRPSVPQNRPGVRSIRGPMSHHAGRVRFATGMPPMQAVWEIDEDSRSSFMKGLGTPASSAEWFALRREIETIALNPGFDRLITLDCNTIKELPHQIDVALRVLRRPMSGRAILADEVGLGKTIEAGII